MFITSLLTVCGLSLFEAVSSVDNAIINAEVLHTMGAKARRWFMTWGMFIAVVLVRGLLPFVLVWAFNTSLTPAQIFSAAWSHDPRVIDSIEKSAPVLLIAGGVFMLFLFLHWIFLEEKKMGLRKTESFFMARGIWFYAVVSILLSCITWFALGVNNLMGFGAVIGSSLFFITHGFKQNAEKEEAKLLSSTKSDISKLLFLEIIDTTFSIDGVLGAFAFTLSVPLILLGNGLGALIVRELTLRNIDRIKRYAYLKNGAMYSILVLGIIMIFHSFGYYIPEYISPMATIIIIGFFFWKSQVELRAGYQI
jgi:hypothetical protein